MDLPAPLPVSAPHPIDYLEGWNACREAFLQALAARHPAAKTCPRCDGSLMPESDGRGGKHLCCRQCHHTQPIQERN